jgi:hypothetical protein
MPSYRAAVAQIQWLRVSSLGFRVQGFEFLRLCRSTLRKGSAFPEKSHLRLSEATPQNLRRSLKGIEETVPSAALTKVIDYHDVTSAVIKLRVKQPLTIG